MDINYAYKQFKYWEETGFSKSETPNSEALVMAIEAIEKQIPRKPKHILMCEASLEYGYVCGECEFTVFKHNRYCNWCGQKIDWEVKE
jgi:hypothetical protein